MKTEKKIFLATLAALLILIAPANATFRRTYAAQITVDGQITLKGMKGQGIPLELEIQATFVAMVPGVISPGEYKDAEFRGFATVTRSPTIKFDGILTVDRINFWVKFAAAKPEEIGIQEGIYSAQGTLAAIISEYTPEYQEIIWALMKGKIAEYDGNNAIGNFMAHMKISAGENWTKAFGFFTLQPLPTVTPPANFSISVYFLTLKNTTKIELYSNEKTLYVEGNWSVWNKTVSVTVVDSSEITVTIVQKLLLEDAPGSLSVTLSSEQGTFFISIEGLEGDIKGDVVFYHVRFVKPDNSFNRAIGIPRGDFNRDGVVNILDVIKIAKTFNARFGMPGYDFDCDINCDFVINIIDLTEIAREFGNEY
ncbi:MAG: dockerin type I domain-containing protein [Candidatus Bathyarchaeia archaeon]